MTRKTNIDMDITCKKFETALNRFFKKYPEHEEWREVFEWMYENNVEFYSDNFFADGTKNEKWCYALHLDIFESGHFYMALIERE